MSRTEAFELSGLVCAFAAALLLIGLQVGIEPTTLGILIAVSSNAGLPVDKWLREKMAAPKK
ncbi:MULTISPECIES: hypothetical protein [unclassified Glutamicibacter]|uniref:hypothetical protein n=1 Tax=unclassified Glutamicibacter TaxID=2627139 RepID=UPI002FCA5DCC